MNFSVEIRDEDDIPFSEMALVNLFKLDVRSERIKSKIRDGDEDPELLQELQDIQKEMDDLQDLATNF
ncbi:MAG: hypothetical protein PHV24_06535 [Candidatus Kapabacteria bacterium]|nr:hypothetical protein [Candidatus Kapabacteria bacterium]